MKKQLIKIIGILLFASTVSAQSFSPILATKLQNTIDSMKIANSIKGISASVIYPGQGMWKGVTGDSYSGFPITSDMEFGIASNTKLFTGVITLKLAESGVISLNDSLHNWLPTFTNVDSNITIRQLLNHTTGLADVNSVVGYSDSILLNPNRIYTPTEVMTWVGTPLFAAGTGWNYSNTDYLLAAMIAESATGQSFGKLLHDSILTPLQLDSTFLDVYDSVTGTVAHPWQSGVDKSAIPRKALNSAAWSSGGMYSTSSEMAQWYNALMNGQVLNSNAFNEMTTFVGSGSYGVGLYQTSILGRTVWQHGGTIWGGYNSTMMYDTTTHAVICVLINQNPAQAFMVAKQLLQTLISNPVGVKENKVENSSYSIFPNPTGSTLFIKSPSNLSNSVNLEITNSFGQTVLQQKQMNTSTDGSFSVDLSSVTPGIYFLEIVSTSNNEKQIIKFLKK